MIRLNLFALIMIISVLSTKMYAQMDSLLMQDPNNFSKENFNTWSITAFGGINTFYGDLQDYEWIPEGSEMKTGFGLSVNKILSPVFTLQAVFFTGQLAGSKKSLDFRFETKVMQYGLLGSVNVSNLIFPNKINRKFSTYALLGMGLVDIKSQLIKTSTDAFVHGFGYDKNGNEIEATTELDIPVGLCFKYQITKKIDVGIMGLLHNTNTDKLDAYRQDSEAKDKFLNTSLCLTYTLGSKEDALDWTTPFEILNTDKDDDGVPDILDKDPNTEPDVAVDGSGLAMDSDNDGVPDNEDVEPNTPHGAKVNLVGKSFDKDKDGVPDELDKEPNSPEGALVNFQGITISSAMVGPDDDKDGIPNNIDQEKNTPPGQSVNALGVSVQSCNVSDSMFSAALPSVYFNLNSTKIDLANFERIAPVAKIMIMYPNLKLEVVGYADNTGNSSYNRKLSKQRAEAVLDVLHNAYGISKDRLFINYFGDTKPLAQGLDAVNRRVDFMIIKN